MNDIHNSVVMTVFNWGILDFSFSFFVVMASVDTSQGEICSRSLELLVFLALLIRFWLLTVLTTAMGNFDLLLLVTEDNERVTGWLDAKDVSCKENKKFISNFPFNFVDYNFLALCTVFTKLLYRTVLPIGIEYG